MIQPHELFVGAILEYNIGTEAAPDWSPTRIDGVDIQWMEGDTEDFNKSHRSIPLTEKILVDWCKDFEHSKEYDKYYKYKTNNIAISFADNKVRVVTGNFVCSIVVAENPSLHLLQMLVQSLTNQPLKITLK